jgi:beta-galactosidase
VSHAAILYDFDNESHAKIESATGQQREASERAIYQALSERHLSVDVWPLTSLERGEELSAFQIAFFAHAHVLAAADMRPLDEYVKAGGTLVFGCWSAYRNRRHWCYDAQGKAFFENLVGIRVEDFTIVPPGEASAIAFAALNARTEAPIFNEVLAPLAEDVRVLATYTSDYYAGKPAVSLRPYGQGRVVYFGSFFTVANVAALLDALAVEDPLRAWAEIPAEVQATVRADTKERFCFLLNFTSEQQVVTFKQSSFELFDERELDGPVEISPYGVCLARL